MKKYSILMILVLMILLASCAHSQECPDGINKLPMYGNVKKCKEQIQDDKIFISDCDKTFKNRQEATAHMLMRGWQYLYTKKLDTAMMRFNQAWLLDSLNAEVYWGYADVLGSQGKFKESLPFFEKSLRLRPDNAKLLQDMSNSYGNIFFETKNVKYLNCTIENLKKAIRITPQNAILYGQLAGAFSYFTQKDSARKYLKLADKIDSNSVNPEVRRMLNNK